MSKAAFLTRIWSRMYTYTVFSRTKWQRTRWFLEQRVQSVSMSTDGSSCRVSVTASGFLTVYTRHVFKRPIAISLSIVTANDYFTNKQVKTFPAKTMNRKAKTSLVVIHHWTPRDEAWMLISENTATSHMKCFGAITKVYAVGADLV